MRGRGGCTNAEIGANINIESLHQAINENVEVGSARNSDEHAGYNGLVGIFFQHETI